MKPLHVISLLIIVVGITTILYHNKIKHEYTELDALQQSINDIRQHIPAHATVAFIGDTNNNQLYMQARYAMAPAALAFYQPGMKYDWLLEIKSVADSLASPANAAYQTKDKYYNYRLLPHP